jgi:hypothetical protein
MILPPRCLLLIVSKILFNLSEEASEAREALSLSLKGVFLTWTLTTGFLYNGAFLAESLPRRTTSTLRRRLGQSDIISDREPNMCLLLLVMSTSVHRLCHIRCRQERLGHM